MDLGLGDNRFQVWNRRACDCVGSISWDVCRSMSSMVAASWSLEWWDDRGVGILIEPGFVACGSCIFVFRLECLAGL